MKNNKCIPYSELKKGMRVKIPWPGKWWGINKKYKWLKGTIIQVYTNCVFCNALSMRFGMLPVPCHRRIPVPVRRGRREDIRFRTYSSCRFDGPLWQKLRTFSFLFVVDDSKAQLSR